MSRRRCARGASAAEAEEVDRLRTEQQNLERDQADLEQKIKKTEKRLYSGEVTSPRAEGRRARRRGTPTSEDCSGRPAARRHAGIGNRHGRWTTRRPMSPDWRPIGEARRRRSARNRPSSRRGRPATWRGRPPCARASPRNSCARTTCSGRGAAAARWLSWTAMNAAHAGCGAAEQARGRPVRR